MQKHLKSLIFRVFLTGGLSRARTCDQRIYESVVKIEFTLPAFAPDLQTLGCPLDEYPVSTTHLYRNGYWWELTLRAVLPGINYKATFEIPVVVE